MPHAHLMVQHVIKQAERYVAMRQPRDLRPRWLADFVQQAADCFEPMADVGRVGFHCEMTDAGWEARLYLGSTEVVGGKSDGCWRSSSFGLDVAALTAGFTTIEEFRWTVANSDSPASFLTIQGHVGENSLCVKVYSRSPEDLGPALRAYQDGRIDTV